MIIWRKPKVVTIVLVALLGAGTLAACGTSDAESGTTLRLGYFPNLTHATALVATEKRLLAKQLGPDVTLKTATFNAGPAAVDAIFSKSVDATFVGPNPAINAWAKSKGKAVKIISGAASGGASLVVKPGINSVSDLKGKRIATPQLGNTQDVAVRYYLKQKGLTANKDGSGDVTVVPQENAQTLQTFAQGSIDGAWVPEPFVSRLIIENKAKKLLNEKDLWPGGKFVTTHLMVRTEFLEKNRDLVRKLLQASVEANAYLNDNQPEAKKTVNAALTKLTGKPVKPEVLDAAFREITFTDDPVPSSLTDGARHAEAVGLLKPVDLKGIYHLGPLNEILKTRGKTQVNAP